MTSMWRRLRRRSHDIVLAALRGDAGSTAEIALRNDRKPQPWLSTLYGSIIAAKRQRELAHAVRIVTALSLPVISVGNLTFGATGKTPCVMMLADLVLRYSHDRGRQQVPMLLTRGYGDDEWRLFQSKFPSCALAVGSDRLRVGRAKVREVGLDALSCVLLDDGLQQWRVSKDLEVVMVDALHPFGNGLLIPHGSLRERPRDALARADVIMIHHAELLSPRSLDALKIALLAAASATAPSRTAPILATSRMRVQRLVRVRDMHSRQGDSADSCSDDAPFQELAGKTALVVCGVGNPESVRLVVASMGCWRHVQLDAFPDHHMFSRGDLRDVQLAAEALARAQTSAADGGGVVVVTTEKDFHRAEALMRELAASCDVRVLQCALELQDNAQRVHERVQSLLLP